MTGIIIQARMGSSRLPQKVFMMIEGKTVLEHVLDRVKAVDGSHKIIVATTEKKEDDTIVEICRKCGVLVFRGSENDVLDRFYNAAVFASLNNIVRITADCPLIDPEIIRKTIKFYKTGGFDYVGNAHPPTFPDGMDVEVFNFNSLRKCWEEARREDEREHVTTYILRNPERFKIGNFAGTQDLYDLRLTLDEREDFDLISAVYANLYSKSKLFGLNDIINLFSEKPELLKINQNINSHPISRWAKNQNGTDV